MDNGERTPNYRLPKRRLRTVYPIQDTSIDINGIGRSAREWYTTKTMVNFSTSNYLEITYIYKKRSLVYMRIMSWKKRNV